MTYTTTHHPFIIDDKHPADVFEEMENFFSLYALTVDSLKQLSVQLSVPASFAIDSDAALAEHYRQFVKALRYAVPDIHVLAVEVRDSQELDPQNKQQGTDDANTVILLIQRYEGDERTLTHPPIRLNRLFGRLLPSFAAEQSPTGLYPATTKASPLPEPVATSRPTLPPIQTSSASALPSQPLPAVPTVESVAPPMSQLPAQSIPQVGEMPNLPPAPALPPVTQPATPASSMSSTPPQPIRLPSIGKRTKPYRDLLTQAVWQEASRQQGALQNKVITSITLTSSDSLTTAFVEQLFKSFQHASQPNAQSSTQVEPQIASDAIDLVSYGYEVLKPKLATIGVKLADDASFGLKTQAKTTPQAFEQLNLGNVDANQIRLGIKFRTRDNQPAPSVTSAGNHPNNAALHTNTASNTPASLSNLVATFDAKQHPTLNQNRQRIALSVHIQDALGSRQQTVHQFPLMVGSTAGSIPTATSFVKVFPPASDAHPHDANLYLAVIELDGQVMIDGIANNIQVIRQTGSQATNQVNNHGNVFQVGAVLVPNDVLVIQTLNARQPIATLTLGVAGQ